MSPLNHEPEALAWALAKSGLTQRQLREVLLEKGHPVSAGHLSEIINGIRNCRQPLLEAIAAALNCPVVVLERKRDLG
jgi:hypothetical protein